MARTSHDIAIDHLEQMLGEDDDDDFEWHMECCLSQDGYVCGMRSVDAGPTVPYSEVPDDLTCPDCIRNERMEWCSFMQRGCDGRSCRDQDS